MKIGVINAGSSSLKFRLIETGTKKILISQIVENIGEHGSEIKDHHEALERMGIDFSKIDAIGHRVVHGGEEFSNAVLIDERVKDAIEKLSILAPLHNKANLEGIRVAQAKAPNIPHIAVFDTAFHATMPKAASLYALPYEMYEKHNIRRYGFHGTSHSYVMKEAACTLLKDVNSVNLITLHLGNGASACAIQNGQSIDTSMGFTPLEGLIMGSRSGDIDPSVVFYMHNELGMSLESIETMLNKESGLMGICNENDVRKVLKSQDEHAKLALEMMIRRIQKYIGAYLAILGSVDAIVFTGGIGENSSYIRESVMSSELLKNIKFLSIETNEELEIANEAVEVIKSKGI
ncbi:MAG: acetate kinase [Campylobacterales bacterium]|nr:acetate kinase [Campylobacterales bacterium]